MTFGREENAVSLTSSPDPVDIFVVKYTSTGDLDWAQKAGGDTGNGLVILPDNSILVVGYFWGVAEFGMDEYAVTLAPEDSDLDNGIFLARYMPDGTLAWAKKVVASAWSGEPRFMEISEGDSSVIVNGGFGQLTIFGDGDNSTTFDQYGRFLAKYSFSGELIWVRVISEKNYGIAVSSDGSIYQTGYVDGMPDPEHSGSSISRFFISKHDKDGTDLWRELGSNEGLYNSGYGICASPNGTTLIIGRFRETTTFGTGENEVELFVGDRNDINVFIAHYAADGTLIWAQEIDSTYTGESLACPLDGTFVSTGSFDKTLLLGKNSNSTLLTATGEESMFLAKYEIE